MDLIKLEKSRQSLQEIIGRTMEILSMSSMFVLGLEIEKIQNTFHLTQRSYYETIDNISSHLFKF